MITSTDKDDGYYWDLEERTTKMRGIIKVSRTRSLSWILGHLVGELDELDQTKEVNPGSSIVIKDDYS